MTTKPMTIHRALAVCIAYIREFSGNENVYGLGESISLTDLDNIVAWPSTVAVDSLIDIWTNAMATSSINEEFFAAKVLTTGAVLYGLSELEGYIGGLNDGLKRADASLLVEIETIDAHGDRLQTITGYLGEVAG